MKGRTRHLLVDTMGLLLAVVVHSATSQDRDGATDVLTYIAEWLPRVHTIVGDGGYAGKLGRWVRERTFGWLGRSRRLRTDYEGRTAISEALGYVAMIHLMLRRLSR